MKKLTLAVIPLILLLCAAPEAAAARELVPLGRIVGLELGDGSLSIASFDSQLGVAAKASGLRRGDQILEIDKEKVSSVSDVRNILSKCGEKVSIKILRGGKEKVFSFQPTQTADGAKLGLYLKSCTTGVGTVTFYDPETGEFGALGHGVNDSAGKLLQMQEGKVFDAAILAVKKGCVGTPGHLMGSLIGQNALGTLEKNTNCGVFGRVDTDWQGSGLPVAETAQIRTGDAVIRSTISGNTVREYSVKILKLYPSSRADGRNMLVKITDPALLEATGGIVQGMSGSPIIQNGKLVGAVTHVLVNDPTTGYGIFIENMLDAAA